MEYSLVVFRLSPCSECSLCSFGNFPSVRSIKNRRYGTQCQFHRPGRSGMISLAIVFHVISSSDLSPFQLCVQVGEQPKVARSHVRRVGSLLDHRNVVSGQESLNQLRAISWCVVMMQLPRSRCPQIRSLAPNSIMKATKAFQVVFFVNVLALWCILMMHHSTVVKENDQQHFNVALHLTGLFWPREC